MCRRTMFVVVVMMLVSASMNLVHASVPDIIAWWTCDEGAGSVVGDATGNGHDGTFVNGDPAWGPGIHGSAVVLVGPTLVEIPPLNMELTEATMAGWIKPNGSQPDWSSFIMTRGVASGFNILGYQLAYHWNDTSDSWSHRGGDMIAEDDWTFCAVVIEPDKATFYVNGVAGSVNEISHGPNNWNANIYLGGDGTDIGAAPTRRMNGALDDVSMFSRALTADEIQVIMQGLGDYPTASSPTPANGAIHPDTWVNLAWRAGDFAVSHDVYIGDNFDAVNEGAEGTFLGNQAATFLVVGFPGFAFPDGLVPGTTYYWRIDEVNDANALSPWKGNIWNFSIEPYTAYNPDPADGAEAVSVDARLNWTKGFGAILHNVYFGDNFDDVSNAAGNPPWGTTTFDPGPLEMAKTYFWRVDEFDAIETRKGNVWSFTTEGAVGTPNPANGAVDVSQTPVLTWVPGVFADTHEVFFGADAASLELKGSGNLGSESFEPGELEWNTTYFWRIDEANNANANSPWTGPLWSFTTANFLIIDDMESYNDLDPADPASNRIFLAWVDGLGDATNGSLVGYENPPFAEQSIVHTGGQSMPFAYDNAAGKSEATLTLTSNRDWTVNGVNTLRIWHRGSSGNAAEQMYVTLNGSARVDNDDPDAATKTSWTEWNIDLQAFADQGVNLSNVSSITLGLSSVTGGTGTVFFDDIQLHPPAP